MCFSRWEFLTEGGDVGFHVYFHRYDQENDILDLVAPDRIPSHLVIEEGQIICDSPGKCKIAYYNYILKSIAQFYIVI